MDQENMNKNQRKTLVFKKSKKVRKKRKIQTTHVLKQLHVLIVEWFQVRFSFRRRIVQWKWKNEEQCVFCENICFKK